MAVILKFKEIIKQKETKSESSVNLSKNECIENVAEYKFLGILIQSNRHHNSFLPYNAEITYMDSYLGFI